MFGEPVSLSWIRLGRPRDNAHQFLPRLGSNTSHRCDCIKRSTIPNLIISNVLAVSKFAYIKRLLISSFLIPKVCFYRKFANIKRLLISNVWLYQTFVHIKSLLISNVCLYHTFGYIKRMFISNIYSYQTFTFLWYWYTIVVYHFMLYRTALIKWRILQQWLFLSTVILSRMNKCLMRSSSRLYIVFFFQK